MVELLDQKGNSNLGLSALTELNLLGSFTVPSEKTLTVSGDSGKLALGGTLTFQTGSKFVLDSPESTVSGVFDF